MRNFDVDPDHLYARGFIAEYKKSLQASLNSPSLNLKEKKFNTLEQNFFEISSYLLRIELAAALRNLAHHKTILNIGIAEDEHEHEHEIYAKTLTMSMRKEPCLSPKWSHDQCLLAVIHEIKTIAIHSKNPKPNYKEDTAFLHALVNSLNEKNSPYLPAIFSRLKDLSLDCDFVGRELKGWNYPKPLPTIFTKTLESYKSDGLILYFEALKAMLSGCEPNAPKFKILWYTAIQIFARTIDQGTEHQKAELPEACDVCFGDRDEAMTMLVWPPHPTRDRRVVSCKSCLEEAVENQIHLPQMKLATLNDFRTWSFEDPEYVAKKMSQVYEPELRRLSEGDCKWVHCDDSDCVGGVIAKANSGNHRCMVCSASIQISLLLCTDLDLVERFMKSVECFNYEIIKGENGKADRIVTEHGYRFIRSCYHCGDPVEKGKACTHLKCHNMPQEDLDQGIKGDWNFVTGRYENENGENYPTFYKTLERLEKSHQSYIPRRPDILVLLGFYGDPKNFPNIAGKSLTKEELKNYTKSWPEHLASLRKEQTRLLENIANKEEAPHPEAPVLQRSSLPPLNLDLDPVLRPGNHPAPSLHDWVTVTDDDGSARIGQITAVSAEGFTLEEAESDQSINFNIGNAWSLLG